MKTFVELVTEIKKSFDQEDNKALANIEDSIELSTVATSIHAQGSYLIYGKKIYEVLTDIAVGDTLVISPATGANIKVADDIMAMIQSLTNQVKDMNNVYGAKNFVEIEDFTLLKSTNRYKSINLSNFINGEIPSAMVRVSFTVSNSNLSTSDNSFVAYSSNASMGYIRFGDNGRYSFTFDGSQFHHFYIYIANNEADTATCTISDIMVTLASITDDTYEPYAKTNQQLTKDVEHTGNIEPMLNVLGAKNLLPNNAMSQTINGVIFTVNDDGSITANGTATAVTSLHLYGGQSFADENIFKGMKMKGCPSGSISNNYLLVAQGFTTSTLDNPVWYTDSGNGVILGNDDYIRVYIRIANGVTVSNLTFRPMICLTELEDDTYAPYAKTNQQLTEDTTALLDNTEVNGAVNMLASEVVTQTINGITFTVNDDGSITANGTATADISLRVKNGVGLKETGQYKLSGGPSGGSTTTYNIAIFKNLNGNNAIGRDLGEGFVFDYSDLSLPLSVYIIIRNGVTISNLTFKPMITVPSYNSDYVPYAKSNRELTEDAVKYKEVTLTYESPVTLSPNTSGRFYITDSTLYNSKLVGVEITGSNLGSDIVAINAIGLTKDPTIARICVPIYNNSSADRSVSSVTLRVYYI